MQELELDREKTKTPVKRMSKTELIQQGYMSMKLPKMEDTEHRDSKMDFNRLCLP